MQLTGANLVAGQERAAGRPTIAGHDPRTGKSLQPLAHEATDDEVAAAAVAAANAAPELAALAPAERARLLDGLADALDAAGSDLVAQADAETGLGAKPRLEGELARTTGQLRFLGDVVRDGGYLECMIDHVEDGPTVRRMLAPLGPVVVFAASNFPLAFSVAGGDTASALATGCPVIVKAHPSHPLTSELTARVVTAALADSGVQQESFSLVHGFEAGRQLVLDERVEAVAFTGSHRGGMALVELSQARDHPIPVYAEMGSINPVVVTSAAASARAQSIAEGFVASFTLGTGQFCTKPGLLFAPADAVGDELVRHITVCVEAALAGPMLNARIHQGWEQTVAHWSDLEGVAVVTSGNAEHEDGTWGHPVLFETDATTFAQTPDLLNECFGPASVVVRYRDIEELLTALERMGGNLTGAIHATDDDEKIAAHIARTLAARVGRVIWNGWPTGVAVTWAMHHGGPYPATSDPLFTSVGATALRRFLRPVAFQDVPDRLLPAALQDANPLGLPRRVDGRLVAEAG